ncbi:poly(ADP-ribose) glycohydrolase-like isoform X1 [Rhodnius prolixus]|uniref:poly(ADP-ribose) glycohydrolase-like isoform X1 n=1 Tax=Rhodnius prolixus TaxID=13249 RepID=UPI003D189DA3
MSELNVSQDLFEESCSSQTVSSEKEWLGVSIEEFKLNTTEDYVPVKASSNHTVLFKVPVENDAFEPYPEVKVDKWDAHHVRMPHSPQSLFPVSESRLESRWPLVKAALKKDISSSKELESAIFSYNSKGSQKWSFDALHQFFSKTLDPGETKYFFKTVLPGIVELAFDIERKIPGGIPFLKKGMNRSISMSQEQAAVLLANAFLCTYPRRNSTSQNMQFPSINFNRLFQCGSLVSVQQKLKCFINYFRRVYKKRPQGVITFTRRCVKANNLPIWAENESELTKLYISHKGTIEEDGAGLLEIDFANKYIGGGVLGRGAVQEEIKFLICPELVVSRLFTECLDDNEALIVTGCERFNKYVGYGDTFTWAGNYVESKMNLDSYRRLNSVVIAIDATHFNASPSEQYKLVALNRELNKAHVGFSFGSYGNIATGNWGCGAFKGDPRFKFLIQLMAASVNKKNVAYFTFGDIKLRDDLYAMYNFIKTNKVTVGTLWHILSAYYDTNVAKKTGLSLYDYLHSTLGTEKETLMEVSDNSIDENKSPENDDDSIKTNDTSVKCQEPVEATVYSLKTDEGRKRCIETEKERWGAYQDAMAKHSNSDEKNIANRSGMNKNAPVKRKISDYFAKASNN